VRPHRQPRAAESAIDCKGAGFTTQKQIPTTSDDPTRTVILGAALPRIAAYSKDSHIPKGLPATPISPF